MAPSSQALEPPGNPARFKSVDKVFEDTDADRAHERIAAAKNGHLNVKALTEGNTYPARLIDHIDKNSDNGDVSIEGLVGEESLKINTKEGVKRRIREAGRDEKSILSALVAFLREI